MTEKRTTKKAEPKPDEQAEEQVSPARSGPNWPFEDDHYLSVPVASRRGHSEGPSVHVIQQALGVEVTGTFDDITAAAVGDWQRENGLPVSRVVDRATWEQLLG